MNVSSCRIPILSFVCLLVMPTLAVTMPNGFVYRARCKPATSGSATPKTMDVTLRLYDAEDTVVPSWTGYFPSVPLVSDGLFQIWVSEAAHFSKTLSEETLEKVLQTGKGTWLGVSFGRGRECQPRRMLVTAPLANASAVAARLDRTATIGLLDGCTTLTSAEAEVDTLVCDTFVFEAVEKSNLNCAELNVRSVTLLSDSGNAILSRSRSNWSEPVTLETGAALTNTLGKAAYLTIRSTESRTAPLLTIPVPAGGAFVWQAPKAKCVLRFMALGVE